MTIPAWLRRWLSQPAPGPARESAYQVYLFDGHAERRQRGLTDEHVALFWRLLGGPLQKQVFHDGVIRTADGLLALARDPKVHFYGVYLGTRPLGFAWVNEWTAGCATLHYAPFPGSGGHVVKAGRELCRRLLTAQLDESQYFLETLLAITPETYTWARRLAKRIGFKSLGVVPNALDLVHERRRVGAAVAYITKNELTNGG